MNTDQYQAKTCRYCDHALPKPFLELGTVALANSYVAKENAGKPEFKCPLNLTWCSHCGLVQLSHIVPPDLMFKNYLYVSSTTQTFRDHFAEYAETVKNKLEVKKNPVAVDIGSNDGLLVSEYNKQGMRGLGVDPAENLAVEANRQGRKTLNRYFDAECVKVIKKEYGGADAISGNNVFAHIAEVQSVLKNVRELLSDQGFFVVEFPYLVTMLDELLFDMIYHEHISYIAVTPLDFFTKRFDLEIFDIQKVSSHGGSLRVFIQKKNGSYRREAIVDQMIQSEKARGIMSEATYRQFAKDVIETKNRFMRTVREIKKQEKSISGYGAPAKASTLVGFYGLSRKEIDYVVDDNPLKQNWYVPGAQIPIVSSAHLNEHPTDYVVIFAWNFAKEIMRKISHLKDKGVEFLIPVGLEERSKL